MSYLLCPSRYLSEPGFCSITKVYIFALYLNCLIVYKVQLKIKSVLRFISQHFHSSSILSSNNFPMDTTVIYAFIGDLDFVGMIIVSCTRLAKLVVLGMVFGMCSVTFISCSCIKFLVFSVAAYTLLQYSVIIMINFLT